MRSSVSQLAMVSGETPRRWERMDCDRPSDSRPRRICSSARLPNNSSPHDLHCGTWRFGTVNSYTESSWAALVLYEIVANSTVFFRHFGQRQGNGRSLVLPASWLIVSTLCVMSIHHMKDVIAGILRDTD